MANARHQACRSADRSGRVTEASALKEGVLRCRTRLEKLTAGLPTSSLPRYEPYLNADRQSDSLMSLEIVPRKFQPHPGRRRLDCQDLTVNSAPVCAKIETVA